MFLLLDVFELPSTLVLNRSSSKPNCGLRLHLHSQPVMSFGDGLAVLDLTWNICERVRCMIANMKGNKSRHDRLKERVKALQIKQSGPAHISELILSALQELRTSLACAEVMLIQYSQSKGIKHLVKSNSFTSKFQDLNQRLNENYLTLSGALQAEHRDVLQQVYAKVSGNRMDQVPWSSPASPPVPLLVPQPPTVAVPVQPSGLLSPVQLPPLPGLTITQNPFFVPPPPVPTITFTAPSSNIIVSPLPPVPTVTTQVVVSSTLSPPLGPVLGSYTVRPPFFP